MSQTDVSAIKDPMVYRIGLSMLKGMTVALARNLLGIVGTEEDIMTMSDRALQSALGRPEMKSLSFSERSAALRRAAQELDFTYANSIRCVYFGSTDYPLRLLECDDAPVMLYVLGNCDLNSPAMASVVGTRHSTPYGLGFTSDLVKEFKNSVAGDITVISGLAYGIDVAAHQEALRQGLPTVGVLAHGLDMLYPAAHRQIAAKMVRSNGGLVTEYPSGTQIHRGNFLARNRIVAGMADCLVVVESAAKGGALVTARIAGDYDREVFALPGRISDLYSEGCNALIATSRAHLADTPRRIIDHMGWPLREPEGTQRELFPQYTPEEENVVGFLRQNDGAAVNTLSVGLGIPMGRLLSLMVEMEFKGLVIKYPGGRYRLK